MPMRFAALTLVALLAAGAMPSPARAGDARKNIKSVDVELPFGDLMFPPGPGAEAINGNCLACHSAEMVLDQPRLPAAAWQAEVSKMRHVFAAPISDDDAKQIVAYLVHLKGAT